MRLYERLSFERARNFEFSWVSFVVRFCCEWVLLWEFCCENLLVSDVTWPLRGPGGDSSPATYLFHQIQLKKEWSNCLNQFLKKQWRYCLKTAWFRVSSWFKESSEVKSDAIFEISVPDYPPEWSFSMRKAFSDEIAWVRVSPLLTLNQGEGWVWELCAWHIRTQRPWLPPCVKFQHERSFFWGANRQTDRMTGYVILSPRAEARAKKGNHWLI